MPVASADDAPKFGVIVTPGWAASNCFFSVVNDSCREAAAKTLTLPVIAAAVLVDPAADEAPAPAGVLLELHAVRTTTAPVATASAVSDLKDFMNAPGAR